MAERRRRPAARPAAKPTAEKPAAGAPDRPEGLDGDAPVPLRGSAARVVSNMTTSLEVPTATSFRVVPAKLLEVNRLILNNQLARTGTAGKVSFTHLIGWAIVQAVQAVPAHQFEFRRPCAHQDGAAGELSEPDASTQWRAGRVPARPCQSWVLPSTSSGQTAPDR